LTQLDNSFVLSDLWGYSNNELIKTDINGWRLKCFKISSMWSDQISVSGIKVISNDENISNILIGAIRIFSSQIDF
jgi:hypothetical protein